MSDLVSLDECFLSVGEILALKCPALPTTERRLADYIERHNWRRNQRLARERRGRGGGWEYHYSVLPKEAQATFLAFRCFRQANAAYEARRESLWRRFGACTDAARNVAMERRERIEDVYKLRDGGVWVKNAVELAAREAGIGPATIFDWIKRIKGLHPGDWLPALLPQRVGRTATAECHPRAWEILKTDYLRNEKPLFGPCYQRLLEIAAAEGLAPIPCEKTLRRRMEREVPITALAFLRGGLPELQKLYPYQLRTKAHFAPLEAVNADGHRLDVFVKFEDGTVGRPMLVAVQDLYSGMIVGHRLGRNEDWQLVRLAFADMIENFGIPERVYLDNGRAFASKMMTGGAKTRYRFKLKPDEPLGVLSALKIETLFTLPEHGQSKPIERAFRDLAEHISKGPECAGAYTGNKPDAKPANYGSKAIQVGEMREIVARAITRHNNRQGRRTETTAGRSFAETYRAALPSAMIRQATPEELHLLMAAQTVKCRKHNGEIFLFEKNRYWDDKLMAHAGRKVVARFDPDDLLAGVFVYTLAGEFICDAPAIEATGFSDINAAKRKAQLVREWLKLQIKSAEASLHIKIADMAALIPAPAQTKMPPAKITRIVRAAARTALAAAPRAAEEQAAESFGRAIRAIAEGENVVAFPGSED